MNFHFILVKPARAENVGAVARGLKTMGFKSLRIVNSDRHKADAARWTAHGAEDILQNTSAFKHLEDALADCDFVVGTTTRQRWVKQEYMDVRRLPEFLHQRAKHIQNTALVFGSEESGLSNQQLSLCDIASSIPMATNHPSLNLSHAVMIYAWECAQLQKTDTHKLLKGSEESLKRIKSRVSEELNELGIPHHDLKHGRILDRISYMNESDLKLLQTVLRKL